MAEPWTHERVLDLVAGRDICCSDGNADRVDAPPWLFASGATEAGLSLGQRVALTHAEDRQTVIDSWLRSIHQPGEIVETEVRIKLDGAWVPSTTRGVNLLDDPAFGVVVELTLESHLPSADERTWPSPGRASECSSSSRVGRSPTRTRTR